MLRVQPRVRMQADLSATDQPRVRRLGREIDAERVEPDRARVVAARTFSGVENFSIESRWAAPAPSDRLHI